MSATPQSPSSTDASFALPPSQLEAGESPPRGLTLAGAVAAACSPTTAQRAGDSPTTSSPKEAVTRHKDTAEKRRDLLEMLDILQVHRLCSAQSKRDKRTRQRANTVMNGGGYDPLLADSSSDDGGMYEDGGFDVDIDSSTTSLLMTPVYALGRAIRGAFNFLSGSDSPGKGGGGGGSVAASLMRSPVASASDATKQLLGIDEERVRKAVELRAQLNNALARGLPDHVSFTSKRIFVGTWNVAKAAPPQPAQMVKWLSGNLASCRSGTCRSVFDDDFSVDDENAAAAAAAAAASSSRDGSDDQMGGSTMSGSPASPTSRRPLRPEDIPSIAVIGLQEAAMGGTALILETTEAVAEWSEAFQSALHLLAKEAGAPTMYRKLRAVQLVGLIMIIFVQHTELREVRNLRTAVTRTGPLSVTGNKGAVGCRLTFHGKRLLFICGHFAPHEHNVSVRDHHYHSALDRLELDVPDGADDLCDFVCRIRADTSVDNSMSDEAQTRGATLASRIFQRRDLRKLRNSTERSRLLIGSHDYCFFFGDLNYRLVRGASNEAVGRLIANNKLSQLLQYDELSLGIRKGFIFQQFVEPPIKFLPTYRMVVGSDAYDWKRKPAWTDRILVHALHGEVDTGKMVDSSEIAGGGSEDAVVFLDVDDSRGELPPEAAAASSGWDNNGSGLSNSSFGGSGGIHRMNSNDSIGAYSSGRRGSATPSPSSQPAKASGFTFPSSSKFAALNDSLATDKTSPSLVGMSDSSPASSLLGSSPPPPPTIKNSPSFEEILRSVDGGALNESVANQIEVLWYVSTPSLKMSDHRPVSSAFDITVPTLSQKARAELLFAAKQEIGNIDLLAEIKYAY